MAKQAVIDEWARRVEAEYRSAALTQHLTLWLIQMAASPDLIHEGLSIVSEKLAHADLSHAAFVAAGGTDVPPIGRESLALRARAEEPIEWAVVRAAVEIFCLGEVAATSLLERQLEGCTAPSARAALVRILDDQLLHREFGWDVLGHLFDLPCAQQLRHIVVEELPVMIAKLLRRFEVDGERDRAWGLAPVGPEILEATLEREYRPRFRELDLDVDAAWNAARRIHPPSER